MSYRFRVLNCRQDLPILPEGAFCLYRPIDSLGADLSPVPPRKAVADVVRQILESCGLTLFQVSRESSWRYPDTVYHIPHQFYSDLHHASFTPSMQQVLAFSSITGYRIADWLAVFGFVLDDIARMQATVPPARTRLLDATTYDDQQWVPWLRDNPLPSPMPPILPLGRLLSPAGFRRAASLLPTGSSPFLYAKVGWQDAFAYPDLLPGSIVRVDTRKKGDPSTASDSLGPILFVEHAQGFCLCRVHAPRAGRITPRSTELPYPQPEWQLGREARILGTADVELRPLLGVRTPQVARDFPSTGIPLPLSLSSTQLSLGQLLALARARTGLSFRAASAVTRRIAMELQDPRYFCAPGALSDYETSSRPPRRVHKLFTFAILYSLGFWTLLDAAGLEKKNTGQRPMPESLLPRPGFDAEPRRDAELPSHSIAFLRTLLEGFEEVPLFLHHAVATVAGLPSLSLRDLYWIGRGRPSFYPYLKTAVLAAVNRRSKKPFVLPGKPQWAQPLYLLLTRETGYLATACHLEGEELVAHPFADGFERVQRFRNGVDAEVVGRVVALLRWVR